MSASLLSYSGLDRIVARHVAMGLLTADVWWDGEGIGWGDIDPGVLARIAMGGFYCLFLRLVLILDRPEEAAFVFGEYPFLDFIQHSFLLDGVRPWMSMVASRLQGEGDTNRFVDSGQFFVAQGVDPRSQS